MNTWENGIEPTPEDITKLNTIENVINSLFESPTYGTRQPITNLEVIKALVSLIRNYTIQDRSHYNGYSLEREKELSAHPKHKKTSLYFKGEQLFTNYGPLDCKLDDPEFTGMRINISSSEIQILFDFYNEKFGYEKKCVLFDVITKSPIVDREVDDKEFVERCKKCVIYNPIAKDDNENTTNLAVNYIGKNIRKRPTQRTLF